MSPSNFSKIFIPLNLLLFWSSFAQGARWQQPDFNRCSFYQKADQASKCSEQGFDYLIDYGKHYCEKFKTKSEEQWEGDLKEWTESTGQCLQEMIYTKRHKSCSQIENFAFASHSVCYLKYDICQLNLVDQMRILTTVEAIELKNHPRKTFEQMLTVASKCLTKLATPREFATHSYLQKKTRYATSEIKEAAAKVFELAPSDRSRRSKYFDDAFAILSRSKERSLLGYVASHPAGVSLELLEEIHALVEQ